MFNIHRTYFQNIYYFYICIQYVIKIHIIFHVIHSLIVFVYYFFMYMFNTIYGSGQTQQAKE